MKKLSFLMIAIAFVFASCKNEGTTDTTSNAAETAPAAVANPAQSPKPIANAAAVPSGPTTSISFAETTFDFGEIMDGEKVEHVFKFTNSGKEPLIISNAKGSCGCTVPEWPKDPIKPGDSEEIKVVYNSKGKGKVGGKNETKTVTITANTDPVETRVFIKGVVNKDASEAPAAPANPK